MIGIIDYGMGNLHSIKKAVEYLGFPVQLLTKPTDLPLMAGLILPGVGAFPKAMQNLETQGFAEVIRAEVKVGKPLLGICLGMQLLFEASTELELTPGLGLLKGQVERIQGNVKIPHMGWNQLNSAAQHPLWRGLSQKPYIYFVHSFALSEMTDDVIGTTFYGQEIPVAVAKGNLLGVQFHPEKSGTEGLRILKNFGEMVRW